MILYQSIGLYYYHLVLVVDVWVGEQGGFSGQKRAGLACPTPYNKCSKNIQNLLQNLLAWKLLLTFVNEIEKNIKFILFTFWITSRFFKNQKQLSLLTNFYLFFLQFSFYLFLHFSILVSISSDQAYLPVLSCPARPVGPACFARFDRPRPCLNEKIKDEGDNEGEDEKITSYAIDEMTLLQQMKKCYFARLHHTYFFSCMALHPPVAKQAFHLLLFSNLFHFFLILSLIFSFIKSSSGASLADRGR